MQYDYRFTKVPTEFVGANWQYLGPLFFQAVPELKTDDDKLMLLRRIMENELQCWCVTRVGQEDAFSISEYAAFYLTAVVSGIDSKHLLLYALVGVKNNDVDLYRQGYDNLRRYAKANDCSCIVAYTNNKQVAHLAARLGARLKAAITLEV